MRTLIDRLRQPFPFALAMAFLPAYGALAIDADEVTFDDSTTTAIVGADVQEALESADALHSGVEDDADVVYLRQDCTGIKNCFTSMSDLSGEESSTLTLPTHPSTETNSAWLWVTRQPTPSSPILVDVGPGTWEPFICPDHTSGADFGGVTIRGAGRDSTVLEGEETGFDAQNCFDLQIMDLTARGGTYGVRWANMGQANWHDIDAVATGTGSAGQSSTGWVDSCTTTPKTPSLHYLFNSRAIARGDKAFKVAYAATCSETWFFGGEIRLEATEGGSNSLAALVVADGSDFRAFGTPIRALAEGRDSSATVSGVAVYGGSQQTMFHLHGGIVSMHGSSASGGSHTVNVTGLNVTGNAFAHTPGSAWVVRAPDGTATRVTTSSGGVAQVPFHWQSGTDEPEAGLVSQTGSDIFVETDCNNSSGVCDGSGTTRPHLMIYDASCSPSPWFDVVTGACRQPS